MAPSLAPSYDNRPTLEIVRDRGYIRCGVGQPAYRASLGINDTSEIARFAINMCHAIASVIFGKTDNAQFVEVTASTRFQILQGRSADLLLSRDSHSIERETKERTTGAGFRFSSPYYYDGMSYLGTEELVNCAESKKRYGECAKLQICVSNNTNGNDVVRFSFPPSYYVVGEKIFIL